METLTATISNLINDNLLLGPIVYILIATSAIVITPISTLPFIPFAAKKWGWMATAMYTEIGWLIGGLFAFLLARHFGKKVISKFLSLEKLQKLENKIPKKLGFLSIVLLRMLTPIDIISYALGLTRISFLAYILATAIGIAPAAITLSLFGRAIFTLKHPTLVVFGFIAFWAIYLLVVKMREIKIERSKILFK